MRARLLAPLLLVLLWLPSLAIAAKSEASKQQLEQLHQRIESLKKDLNRSQAAHSEAADALKKSEQAISDANRQLLQLRQQQQQNQAELNRLQLQKTGIESTLQQQRELLATQFYQQYLHGRQSYLQILLQQQDPGRVARELHYFSYVSRARAELIDGMQQNLDRIARLNTETAQTLDKITELKNQQEQQRRELQAQKRSRDRTLKQLASKIKDQRSEISKLKRDEKRLSDLVQRLARIVPKRQPPAAGARKPGSSIARNEKLPSDVAAGSFAKLKGKLRLPVIGDIVNRFGSSREDTGISWKGLFIRASEGSEVKSVAGGLVVFSDWLRGFGNLLIIDHGDGYMSLYGNNQTLLRQVGDQVRGGDTVAAVGNTGGNETAGLYFELRHRSKPFDPLSWSVLK